MISERKFATSFGSFWSSITPLMEEYLQSVNSRTRTYAIEVPSTVRGDLSAVFSEIAFELFTHAVENRLDSVLKLDPKTVRLRSRHAIVGFLRTKQLEHRFTNEDEKEIHDLARNLLAYFQRHELNSVIIRPVFKGCGIVNECEGDASVINVLVEVKAVQRNFSSADMRQILVYLALMHAESLDVARSVVLLNPRLGVFTELNSRELAIEVSGMELFRLLDEIILYMSDLSNVLLPDLNID